ncbi:Hypothetical protein CINCED_3A003946 [Cinara cedri]|uniref:Uncharacterized protein n=1 Tax=Cinara cedri TaxID=506608 RepID=A0A5E4NKV0_9HEMI|nr:Hypothetical protein CINCED_3A003946 [Cinara cedri]
MTNSNSQGGFSGHINHANYLIAKEEKRTECDGRDCTYPEFDGLSSEVEENDQPYGNMTQQSEESNAVSESGRPADSFNPFIEWEEDTSFEIIIHCGGIEDLDKNIFVELFFNK